MSEVDKLIRNIESIDDLIDHSVTLEDLDNNDEDMLDDDVDDEDDDDAFSRRWYPS